MASEVGIRSSRVSPAFLHGNSTSHTWAFSAIAELIDNAYDPDVNAAELRIDTRVINGTVCLTFVDNGNGMNQEKLHKMLSFGYCDKKQIGKIKPIGYYGNGFKSGSMRLGKDAIVFTRNKESISVGLLSQTFLRSINADSVLVPIVTWDLPSKKRRVDPETTTNLNAILQHSIFKREEELMNELSGLERIGHGTNIIIYNLKMTNEKLELDFTSDPFDIRNPETHIIDLTSINRPIIQYQPEYRRSLREYCSILYLKPRMKIVIRGKKVKTKLMSKSLSQTEMDLYKPTWLIQDKPIHITFGFTSSKNPEDYGIMMYHKNRLIKAFEKVGYQKQASALGVGVIGVVEANFLEPIHNKQDFSRTERYSAFITNVSTKLNDYWNEKTSGGSAQNRTETQVKLPDWTWAQCDNCLKWRRLPTGLNAGGLPEKWYCRMNPDASFNRCDIDEEPEDDDEALQQPTYKKTFKKKQEEKKRAEEYEKMRKIQAREHELKQREEALKRKSIQLSEEVSSSQDSAHGQRRPTVGDLDKAKKRLDVYKERLIEQQKIINNLEKQKKVIEEQSHEMLQMAEQLKLSNINTNNLIENANLLAGTSSSTVSSSSSIKRKADGKGRPTKMFIKTEDGDTVTVIQNEVEEDDNIIDLTSDQEEEEDEEEKQDAKPNASQIDVKPNVTELNQAIKNSKPNVELVHKTVQTVPVVIRLATRDEVDLERLSPLEKRQHLVAKYREVCELQKKLEDTNSRFKSLQGNICNLLKIIVPDFDYGHPDNIENVILDFIRVNADSDSQS